MQEYDLYKAVTAYINEFLPQASGASKQSVALARTVFQRRLASSTMAIYESIRRRLEQAAGLARGAGRSAAGAARPAGWPRLQGRLADAEQDEDDLDDAERDQLVDQFTASVGLDQLRIGNRGAARTACAQAPPGARPRRRLKAAALQACLERAEFKELNDGRGKLLIFTEHRDTLNYLCERTGTMGLHHLPKSTAA